MTQTALSADDASGWAERCEFWAARERKTTRPYRDTRDRATGPLVLCGHGLTLRVERGALVVREGFTHYPQPGRERRLFPGEASLPPRIIVLDGSGTLSFDVLSWLNEQGVTLTRLDWRGRAVSTVGGAQSALSAELVRWQTETAGDLAKRVRFCRALIIEKIEASLSTLISRLPDTVERQSAILTAETALAALKRGRIATVNEVLLIEARAASAYFNAWRGMPLKWSRLKRRPIPQRWLTADVRNANGVRNRNANHPVNAMLNYAYGVLYAQAQSLLVQAGFDPSRGIMHVDRTDGSALALDAMEIGRPLIDAALLDLLNATVFRADDFVLRTDGVCRVAPQLAARIAALVSAAPMLQLPRALQGYVTSLHRAPAGKVESVIHEPVLS